MEAIRSLVKIVGKSDPRIRWAESNMKDHVEKQAKTSIWKARLRSRDILSIMCCVQCNRCQIHGKVASLGLATALKIIIGEEGEGVDPFVLGRHEMGALVATASKLAHACDVVARLGALDQAKFRAIMEQRSEQL